MAKDDIEIDGQEKKKGGFKKILIMLVALVVLLAVAAVALRFFAPGLIPGWGEQKESEAPPPEQEPSLGTIVDMKPFIVNLADPGGNRYLKVVMSFELSVPELQTELDERMPQIRDAVLMLLSSQTREDISYVEGQQRLKNMIAARCNQFLKTGMVKSVYFSEFVIQ